METKIFSAFPELLSYYKTKWKFFHNVLYLKEAASLGIVPCVSFKASPVVIDARKLQMHTAEVSSPISFHVTFS